MAIRTSKLREIKGMEESQIMRLMIFSQDAILISFNSKAGAFL